MKPRTASYGLKLKHFPSLLRKKKEKVKRVLNRMDHGPFASSFHGRGIGACVVTLRWFDEAWHTDVYVLTKVVDAGQPRLQWRHQRDFFDSIDSVLSRDIMRTARRLTETAKEDLVRKGSKREFTKCWLRVACKAGDGNQTVPKPYRAYTLKARY